VHLFFCDFVNIFSDLIQIGINFGILSMDLKHFFAVLLNILRVLQEQTSFIVELLILSLKIFMNGQTL